MANVPLLMENRMLVAAATGVATYARALRTAQLTLSDRALLLGGGTASVPGSPQSRIDRWRRSVRAVLPLGVRAQGDAQGFARHDLFRLGQAFFTIHGRLLPVRVVGPPGIMHWSYPVPLHVAGWRNFYTVHDAIPLTDPELTPIDGVRHRRLLCRLAEEAEALVTVSRSAAGDIATALGLRPEQVIDCSQPVAVEDGGDRALPLGLEAGGYLLVCGSVEPRKNIVRIARAYRQSGVVMPLVVAGPDGWRSACAAAELDATPGAIRLPYQSRASIVSLIASARALLMPSLAEGFGLPVAESMALGTPVVTSADGALAETAGGAALLVDPFDTAALTKAIATIAHDDTLCLRLTRVGRQRARRFDAQSFAERLGTLYGIDTAAVDASPCGAHRASPPLPGPSS